MLIRTGGKLLRGPNGKLVRSTGCCCRCRPFAASCDGRECTTVIGTVCCFKCGVGEEFVVTFGTITASGAGEYAPAAVAMARALSGKTVAFESMVDFISEAVAVDAAYAYGYEVVVNHVHDTGWTVGNSTSIFWAIYVALWRVPVAAYYLGDCTGAEFVGVIQPGVPSAAPNGTCAGSTDLPLDNEIPEWFTVVDPAVSVSARSSCNSVASCDQYPSTLLVNTGCWMGAVPVLSGGCAWLLNSSTCEDGCPCEEVRVELTHSDGDADDYCGWKLRIDITTYRDEYCMDMTTKSLVAHLGGNSPIGSYTVDSNEDCPGTVEVS